MAKAMRFIIAPDSFKGSLSASEIKRPIASATAMVSDPAFPTETKTSNGSPSWVSFTTT